jgi:hypothetical protein
MALPRFLDRVTHSIISAAGPVDCASIAAHLKTKAVRIIASDWITEVEGHREGFLVACNLLARTYPVLIVEAPEPIREAAIETILAINPVCDLVGNDVEPNATLTWGVGPVSASEVCVSAVGWNVLLDGAVPETPTACSPLAAMASATLGVREVFRAVLGDLTGDLRCGGTAIGWNIITLRDREEGIPPLARGVDFGELVLVGCGAIGQAFVAAMGASNCRGRLVAIDPEDVELSNLQRYVLTTNGDVGEAKTSLVTRALEGSEVEVVQERRVWSLDDGSSPACLVCALDTVEDRIGCQGSLPRTIYNAYTGDQDLGWTRHERFGDDACLACIYWPHEREASWTDQVARSLGMEADGKRIALYKVSRLSIGEPLPPAILARNGVEAELAAKWGQSSLLDGLAAIFGLSEQVKSEWSDKDIDAVYSEGLCGGRLVEVLDRGKNELLLVPLAHESVLAGVMLAASVIAAHHPELRDARHPDTKGAVRLSGDPGLPYTSAPASIDQCICSDPIFTGHYHELWP